LTCINNRRRGRCEDGGMKTSVESAATPTAIPSATKMKNDLANTRLAREWQR